MKERLMLHAAAGAVLLIAAGCATAAKNGPAEPAYDTLIAHRGESKDAPENTLPAYRTAVSRGFGFECDIYLSADKRVFTFHDRSLRRTTDGACTKMCHEASWEGEVSKVDVGGWGKWKGSKFVGTRPALLEEVLQLAVDGRYIYVEVKPGPEIVPYIRDIFARQSKATPRNVLFISFDRASCRKLKELMPEYKVYWLTGTRRGHGKDAPAIDVDFVLQGLKETGADGVDCHFDPAVITADFIAAVKAAGYEFHVWTIDDISLARMAFARGAQTVTTNCAQKLLDEYRKGL